MEAVKQNGIAHQDAVSSATSSPYIPALPTLWPHMLYARQRLALPFPFEAPGVRFYYFARNAVWTLTRILGLAGAEVLVPAYHHGVEIEALLDAGASIRYFPVSARMQVDPDDVARLIGPRTRAIHLIHYLGFPGPVQALREIADAHGLALIEDCALSLLSKLDGRPLGGWGDAAVFSLYKTLPVPNGGALVMSAAKPQGLPEPVLPPRLSTASHLISSLLQNIEFRGGVLGRGLRQLSRQLGHGAVAATQISRVATGTQHFDRAHANLGMSPWSRRVVWAQDFATIIEKRRRNFFFLLGHLREEISPVFSQLPPGVVPLFYPLRTPDKAGVMARLASHGIETVNFWSCAHPTCQAGDFPDVDALRREIVEIPIHQDLSPEMMTVLADLVRDAVRRRA